MNAVQFWKQRSRRLQRKVSILTLKLEASFWSSLQRIMPELPIGNDPNGVGFIATPHFHVSSLSFSLPLPLPLRYTVHTLHDDSGRVTFEI